MESDFARFRLKPSLRVVVQLLVPFFSLLVGFSAPADVLFHVSFDEDRDANLARGAALPTQQMGSPRAQDDVRFVPGFVGLAAAYRGAIRNHYEALRNFSADRGTVSMYVQRRGTAKEFDLLAVSNFSLRRQSYYLRIRYDDEYLKMRIGTKLDGYRVIRVPFRWPTENRWVHVVASWDHDRGASLWVDGMNSASKWHESTWTLAGADPDMIAIPTRLGMPPGHTILLDEILILDEVIKPSELSRYGTTGGSLTASGRDPMSRLDSASPRDLGWEPRSSLIVPPPHDPDCIVRIRRIQPSSARAVLRAADEVVDGKPGTTWPGSSEYEFGGGDGLHIKLPETPTHVAIDGYFAGELVPGGSLVRGSSQRVLKSFRGDGLRAWQTLPIDMPREVSLFRAADVKSKHSEGANRLGEISFVSVDSVCSPPKGSVLLLHDSSQVDETQRTRSKLPRSLEMDWRLEAGPDPSVDTEIAIPAYRRLRISVPIDKDLPLRGLRLHLRMDSVAAANRFRIEVHDPTVPSRRIASVDVADTATPEGDGVSFEVVLDGLDQMLLAGDRIPLSIVMDRDTRLRIGGRETGSWVSLIPGDTDAVKSRYRADTLKFIRGRFRALSERRPWLRESNPELVLPERSRVAAELFDPLTRLRQIAPDDPRVSALWLWTHKDAVIRWNDSYAPLSERPGIPEWAVLQRALRHACTRVVQWWIDNRQAPNGEFGDGWGDDTDFVQNYPMLALASDPGKRLEKSSRLVADGVVASGRLESGLNRQVLDTLHAYEEGINAQASAFLISPGDVKLAERLFESAAAVRDTLLGHDSAGRLRFRSSRFGSRHVRGDGPWAYDQPRNALMLHPAATLAWYSRNPEAIRIVKEWIDGWRDLYSSAKPAKAGMYPEKTRMDGSILSWQRVVDAPGFPDLFVMLSQTASRARYGSIVDLWSRSSDKDTARDFVVAPWQRLAPLVLLDKNRQRSAVVRWAEAADLDRPSVDLFGRLARRRLVKWEATGDRGAAIEALRASIVNVDELYSAYTWAQPSNDRIWIPFHAAAVMMFGGIPHERNQTWPRHSVSYEGFSDLSAWVTEKSDEHLEIDLVSFATEVENGRIRVWNLRPGLYRVSATAREKNTARNRSDHHWKRDIELHPHASIEVSLPPSTLLSVEVDRLGRLAGGDFWARPDLAIDLQSASTADDQTEFKLRVVNLGNGKSPATVLSVTPSGGSTTVVPIPPIDGAAQLALHSFDVSVRAVGEKPYEIIVDPRGAISELYKANNRLTVESLPAR